MRKDPLEPRVESEKQVPGRIRDKGSHVNAKEKVKRRKEGGVCPSNRNSPTDSTCLPVPSPITIHNLKTREKHCWDGTFRGIHHNGWI